jgi:conjugative relaxase-like TrwC/TraI family protein
MELVIAAHKSVAELGVVGRAEDMHRIMDVERDATLAYLDEVTRTMGGRRGRGAQATATSGLVYAVTRHATSRAGDPAPHDHVLMANVVEMLDEKGGHKGVDTTLWREHLHAATAVGRMASARRAVELGYAIRPDDGPSGRLGHWAIAGVPEAALEVHSKRAGEIDAAVAEKGYDSYRARGVAARQTRQVKRHESTGDLLPRWQGELDAAGFPVADLLASIDQAAAERAPVRDHLTRGQMDALAAEALGTESRLATRKVFSRRDVVVAVAPSLFGLEAGELDRVVGRVLADPEAVPLLGVAGARERPYACASVIATEQAIAASVAEQAVRSDAATVALQAVEEAIVAREDALGSALTAGQRDAVIGVCTSGRGTELVLGVAGAGKTTCLSVVRAACQAAGYDVVGTATSGQAARTLGREAGISESMTLASLLWRVEHGRLQLSSRSLLVLDEAGMTEDGGLLRLLAASDLAGAKVVLVGDDRQLSSVGPGGGLGALLARQPASVHVLDENVRQHDLDERSVLAELRAGDLDRAVEWYRNNKRIVTVPSRDEAMDQLVDGWATDLLGGRDAAMFAWRRANVAELNRRGRQRCAEAGRLTGPELEAPGGRRFAAGDRIVTLAPGAGGQLVTSERGRVIEVDQVGGGLVARMDDGRVQQFGPEDTAADRLDHGYAVTVHRSQGATVDVAHVLEDGGGRELAYVAMSRARHCSMAYVVADDIDQAAEDLRRDWARERRQGWAIDAGTPAPGADAPQRQADEAYQLLVLRRARLRAQRGAITAALPPEPKKELASVTVALSKLAQRRLDLEGGRGVYTDTPEGQAARDLLEARTQRSQAEQLAKNPQMSRSARRSGRRDAKAWAERLAEAEIIYEQVVVPEVTRLDAEIGQLDQRRADLIILDARQRAGLGIPTGARGRLNRLDQELNQIDAELRFAGKGIEPQGIEHGDGAPLDIPQSLHRRDEPRQGLSL